MSAFNSPPLDAEVLEVDGDFGRVVVIGSMLSPRRIACVFEREISPSSLGRAPMTSAMTESNNLSLCSAILNGGWLVGWLGRTGMDGLGGGARRLPRLNRWRQDTSMTCICTPVMDSWGVRRGIIDK